MHLSMLTAIAGEFSFFWNMLISDKRLYTLRNFDRVNMLTSSTLGVLLPTPAPFC